MKERFNGPAGKRLLTDAISQQTVVHGNQDLAAQIADIAELIACDTGFCLILQNATDNDLYFILTGQFSIQVNGREVARRRAGQHVGEMALIDPKAKRSASVIACEDKQYGYTGENEIKAQLKITETSYQVFFPKYGVTANLLLDSPSKAAFEMRRTKYGF